ncbi:hypothetical protein [Nonomuraea dietziae]|uniref:hypothetical protein n=1 Tax=Nonomuraea dietziae TaxID=65515 RepID=UPI0031D1857F
MPPLRPAGESASHARVPDGAWNTTRAPFDFERFYNDPRWSADATRFEQRLGAYYFNNPETLDAARTALRKMRDVLLELTPRRSDESVEDFTRRVESVFFKDDLASAGQVGKRDVTLDDLLAHGNLRELVTAFYNGAYYNRENPHILGNALLDIMDNNRWNAARDAGLDVGEIRRSQHQLDERMHRPIIGRAEAMFMSDSNTFTRDPFGTGNVGMMSQRGVRDVSEMVSSQHSRRTRTDEEIQELGLHTTPEHYEGLGTPLGKFERAYIEEATQRKLDPDTPLPWREGATMHDLPSSRWAQKTSSAGFLVVDGVSGTTAKMLTAVKFLDLGPKTTEHFLGALMGWMLPGRDHSLFEVAKGAQIAGVGWMPLEPGTRPTAVDFYRNLPNIDLGTLRREVLPDGMFPHEARYYMNATDKAGFTETQPSHIRGIADRLWPQLESGRVTDQSLWRWLERNGVDPTNVDQVRALGERLSPAHLMAMTVYTESSHSLINHVARTQLWTAGLSESVVHRRLADKIHQAVTAYLDNMAGGQRSSGYIPAVVHSALYPSGRSSLHERAQAYVDAARRADEATKALAEHRAEGRKEEARQAGKDLREARRERQEALNDVKMQLGKGLTRLFDEMRWHVDMVHDAMMQLPAVGTPDRPVLAYRGDWLTPVHSPIYGSKWHPHGTAREFLSTSLSLEVAVRFMLDNPAGDRKVLVVYQLTGQQARDISVFSAYASEKEAVLPPRSRTEWVRDQEQVEGVRADVERVITDMVNRRSLSEPPDYEIIVMREAPGDG